MRPPRSVSIKLFLYLSVTTRAVIDQFSGPYSSTARQFNSVFVSKLFGDLSPSALYFYSNGKFKTFCYYKLCI